MNLWEAKQLLRDKVEALKVPRGPSPLDLRTLFHYTSTEGLLGIISSNVLRATNVLYMNDSSELQYSKEMLQQVMNRLRVGASPLGQDFLDRCISDNFSGLSLFQPHVACFCEDGDLLSQWRGYAGQGGGFAIGFDWSFLDTDLFGPPDADLLRIEYDRATQERSIEERIELIRRALDDLVGEKYTQDSILIPAACMLFSQELGQLLLSSKHSAFSEEREWRLVSLHNIREPGMFRFCSRKGMLVPYVDMALHSKTGPNRNKLPISQVVIGPTLNTELTEKSVELLLREFGYHHVTVRVSDVPLRF